MLSVRGRIALAWAATTQTNTLILSYGKDLPWI